MTKREVKGSGKNSEGDIISLCNGNVWPKVTKAVAIQQIEARTHSYYVKSGSKEVDVHVVSINGKKYLRTDADGNGKNNLDNLPDCP
jgi:hypothetical protein